MGTMFQRNADVPRSLTVAFLGDSITDNGRYIALMHAYFSEHIPDWDMRLINLGVSSETASGLSEPDHPFPRPCVHERLEAALQASRPDWVVVCYGMNDGIYHPFSEERFAAYKDGMSRLIAQIRGSGAQAIVMTPPPFDVRSVRGEVVSGSSDEGEMPQHLPSYSWKQPYASYDDVLKRYAEWCLSLGEEADAVVNIRDPLLRDMKKMREQDPEYSSGDGIHPNPRGHWVIVKTLLGRMFNITLERMPEHALLADAELPEWFALTLRRHRLLGAAWKEHVGHTNPNKAADALPLAEAMKQGEELQRRIVALAAEYHRMTDTKVSEWNGYPRTDFTVHGREAIVIAPHVPAAGRPWIWRTEFFGAFDYADRALLAQGWHIAYCRLSHMYGCPGAVERMERFREQVRERFALAPQAALFGFSRGGLYAVHYAAAHPERVLALYLDAPVLDIRSWPGGLGQGPGSAAEWEDCLAVYGLTEQTAPQFDGNPLDRLRPIAEAGIPILLISGDQDVEVPLEENAALMAYRMLELGGKTTLIVKPGGGHHPHSLEQPQPIVDFITEAWNGRA
ncbi:GDSL-type esterase/lipase family protein [Paenibacillus doosanensis]|uniref:alpha/beta fold hydrolase n=1 Tax=Paenibacillus doosanensis TaxID=1229154 RepID=UPI00217FBFAB|nr:alpha/beta fold hydrolase [Paenibacillus doosanensis]MCS7464404.1 GDSL-type esterase/lipase family protein [Paenibacillus doosanensis]